jgi:hypothetical protein
MIRHTMVTVGTGANTTAWCDDNVHTRDYRFAPTTTVTAGSGNSASVLIVPTMQSGAYFTGLSAESALKVTMRYFVEVFPQPGSALVPLAHPSCPMDMKALQCYSEIMREMHAGYPVRDNAAGDFFRKAASVVRKVSAKAAPWLKAIGSIPGVPGLAASAISGGLQHAENIASTVSALAPKKKKANGSSQPPPRGQANNQASRPPAGGR